MGQRQRVVFEAPDLVIPRRLVSPGAGKLTFRCGRCGGTRFEVHVRKEAPDDGGHAPITDLACPRRGCRTVYNIDDAARVAGTQEY